MYGKKCTLLSTKALSGCCAVFWVEQVSSKTWSEVEQVTPGRFVGEIFHIYYLYLNVFFFFLFSFLLLKLSTLFVFCQNCRLQCFTSSLSCMIWINISCWSNSPFLDAVSLLPSFFTFTAGWTSSASRSRGSLEGTTGPGMRASRYLSGPDEPSAAHVSSLVRRMLCVPCICRSRRTSKPHLCVRDGEWEERTTVPQHTS